MTLFADASDALAFGAMLVITVVIPTAGLIFCAATLRRHGLNPWSGAASIVFFVALLIGMVMLALGTRQGAKEGPVLYTLLGCVVVHVLSSLMALRGLVQVRTRRKWSHGRRRAYWMVALNMMMIFVIGAWCYYHVNETFHRTFGR